MKQEQFIFLCFIVRAIRVIFQLGRVLALIGIGYAFYIQKTAPIDSILGFLISLGFFLLWRKPITKFLTKEVGEPPRLWKIGKSEPLVFTVTTLALMYLLEGMPLWYSIKFSFG